MNKVNYTDDVTVIHAQNLNEIQDEIIEMGEKLDGLPTLNTDTFTGTTTASGSARLSTSQNMFVVKTKVTSPTNYSCFVIYYNGQPYVVVYSGGIISGGTPYHGDVTIEYTYFSLPS